MKKLRFVAVFIMFLFSCQDESSDKVDPSNIYQRYLLIYNKSDNITHACAQFRDGGSAGSSVVLNSPSSIKLNGEALTYQSLPYRLYYHYYKKYNEEVSVAEFIFTDKNNKTYTNIANMAVAGSISIPANINTIVRYEDFVLSWVGVVVKDNETVSLDLITNDTAFYYTVSSVGASEIIVPKSDLEYLQTGSANLIIRRELNTNLQAATEKGGEIKFIYEAEKEVTIAN